ncbi:MAG: hemolysin family protein [Candidatus Margulisiibacteriota bacterium]|nr:hemolysin family protein [Candidatus Margulisiibacteriota bacterium]
MIAIIILLVLILLSAFFAASETALTSLSHVRVLRMVEKHSPSAGIIKKLKDRPSALLSTVLIGNNIVNISASVLAASVIMGWLERHGWHTVGLGVGAASGIMTFIILVFGEITPKTVAIRNAEPISQLVAWPIFLLTILFTPVAYVLNLFSRPFVLLFGGKPSKAPFISQEEIEMIIAAGEKEGVLEEDERKMITSIFEFGETSVREVMTPRPDVKSIDISVGIDGAKKVIKESGHSRIPVYEGNIDNVIGILYSKDLLIHENEDMRKFLRSPLFIPETKKVDELLNQMQSARTHIAIIVDEYGVTSGIVTLEDLLEEIVGEIQDEFEKTEKMTEKITDKSWLVDGRVALKDVNEKLGIELPEIPEYDTIGGYVFAKLDKVPAVKDEVKVDGVRIVIEKVHRRRITRVRIELQ